MSKTNKKTYQGELTCPNGDCESQSIRYVKDVTPFRQRYRCRKCGITFIYDLSGRQDLNPCVAPVRVQMLGGQKFKEELQ